MPRGKMVLTVLIGAVLIGGALSFFFVGGHRSGMREPAIRSTERLAQELMNQALEHEEKGEIDEANRLYREIEDEFAETPYAWIASGKINQLGLEFYLRGLDETNSLAYVVQSGDNLTKIAKGYGITAGTIQRSNGLGSDTIWPGMSLRIMTEPWSMIIDKSQNLLSLKAGPRIVKVYPIATGEGDSTPLGEFQIANRLVNPAWYYEGKKVPPLDPENPLGTRWLGFDIEHYGLHGTNDPDIIGKHATLGCVRMRNPDIEEVFALVPIGTKVNIVD